MKQLTALLASVFVLLHAVASAQNQTPSNHQTPTADNPTVRAGIFTFTPEGRLGAAATQSGDRQGADLAGTVYLAPCKTVGGANPGHAVSASATDVWKLTGSVLEFAAEQATVQLGWERVRRAGKDEASAPQWVTVTLKRGERTTLEAIAIPAAGECPARDVSLDVEFSSLRELFERSAAAGPTAGGLAANASVVGRIEKHLTEFGFLGNSNVSAPMSLRAELWLVRSLSGHSDEVRHITSPVGGIPLSFGFAPMSIQASTGTLTVKVEGTIEAGTTPTGEPQFHFSAKRSSTFAPANRAVRDATPIVEASTKTTVAMPGPDEVLSFELPPLQTPDGTSVPDKLSVRVKLAREAMKPLTPRQH